MKSRKIMALFVLVVITAIVFIAVNTHNVSAPIRFLVKTGMSREEVIKIAGVPQEKRSLVKKVGIREDNQFWMQIADNTSVEIWEYRDRQGRSLIYFTNASQIVCGVSFLSNGQPF
jgi:hypothetical protein